jgi:peptidoglycan pentaglycine glycine transferase (the first glycine)
VEAVAIDQTRAPEWDALVEGSPPFSLMQSWDWGEVKRKLGWIPHRQAVSEGGRLVAGAQMLVKKMPAGIPTLAYIPCGPVGDWTNERAASILFGALHATAKDSRAAFLKIEPSAGTHSDARDVLGNHGFRPSSTANQPRATVVVDITSSPEEILRSMRNSTRRKIQSTDRRGVQVRPGSRSDLPVFYDLMKLTAKRAGFTLRSYQYFETEFHTFEKLDRAIMLIAEIDGQVIAAHIVYAFGANAAFFHQASDTQATSLNPNALLVWRGIEWARARGCTKYDLWGIPDEVADLVEAEAGPPTDRTDGLWGVYRFKTGFSKDVVTYVPSHDYVYSRPLYTALTTVMSGQDALERASSWLDTRFGGSRETQ